MTCKLMETVTPTTIWPKVTSITATLSLKTTLMTKIMIKPASQTTAPSETPREKPTQRPRRWSWGQLQYHQRRQLWDYDVCNDYIDNEDVIHDKNEAKNMTGMTSMITTVTSRTTVSLKVTAITTRRMPCTTNRRKAEVTKTKRKQGLLEVVKHDLLSDKLQRRRTPGTDQVRSCLFRVAYGRQSR